LQRAFPLDILMVPSSALAVVVCDERLSSDGFSLDETIRFGSLEFITDRFVGLGLSPMGSSSDNIVMGVPRGGPPTPHRTLIKDFIEGSLTTSDGEGGLTNPLLRGTVQGLSPPQP
jgi:hypothetical protein